MMLSWSRSSESLDEPIPLCRRRMGSVWLERVAEVVDPFSLLTTLPRNAEDLESQLFPPPTRVQTAYQQSALHQSSDRIRQPACPVYTWAERQTQNEEHRTWHLNDHRSNRERADEPGGVGPVYLGRILTDRE